ncbi:MAG: KipI antagonist [Gemmatimonadetes bacterium]|nr:KipI antagonist [Gemmatimonadota bacterium]
MGHQGSAIPVGGAMDRIALRIGNLLVGNDESCAALEAALIGPAIGFDATTLLALTGGDLDASVDGVGIPVWHPVVVRAGATLRFGRPRVGCRTYVAVAGGIDVPPVFGSRSTYLRAQFGGYEGRALRAGDAVRVGEPSRQGRAIAQSFAQSIGDAISRPAVARWSIGASLRPRYSEDPIVRLVAGAHTDALTAEARRQLTTAAFRVSASSDRMGYRLEGTELALREPLELLSEAVAFGTVQLPPGGAPIVLMADRQTTGGYPRIGEVASVDLPLIAQLKPADRVRFRFVSLDDAQQMYLDQEQDLAQARIAITLRH